MVPRKSSQPLYQQKAKMTASKRAALLKWNCIDLIPNYEEIKCRLSDHYNKVV